MSKHGLPIGVGDLGLTHTREFVEMMDRGGASICQPDISQVGGFTGIQQVAAAAYARGAACASDGFFPFADGLEAAAESGCTAVIAPQGSIRDAEVVAAADRLGIALVFSSHRYFLH